MLLLKGRVDGHDTDLPLFPGGKCFLLYTFLPLLLLLNHALHFGDLRTDVLGPRAIRLHF